MGQYIAPLRDMQFVLHELLHVEDELKQLPAHAEVDAGIINQVLEEGGKFASEVVFPLNHAGDREGCQLDRETHEVTPPKGFKEAYRQYIEAGWPSLSCDPEYGGQGLPIVFNNTFYEMLNSANQAWTMYAGLSHGAYECIHTRHDGAKAAVSAQAGVRRMDWHHVPDRAALRHRPGHAALEGRAAGGWLLQDHRRQDIHLGR